MSGTVRVVPWDDAWPGIFDAEKLRLEAALGPASAGIHHIGSTSVPGLAAKPVIDVLVETPDLDLVDGATAELEALGYEARGEHGIPGRRYFSRPPGPGPKVHVHAFRSGDPNVPRHIRFREYLRAHPADAAVYGELKRRLAAEHHDDPEAYQAAKADFIARIDALAAPPVRIETENLVIRRWSEPDAPLLRDAIDSSLEHLRAWMPWASSEPKSLDESRALLARFAAKFDAAEDFVYGIFDREEAVVLGGTGLHPRIGHDGLEIGYWVRADHTRRGVATEAARTLTGAGLRVPGVVRIQIRCEPENVASRRIPERLGYRLVEVLRGDAATADGRPRDAAVFEITAGDQLAAAPDPPRLFVYGSLKPGGANERVLHGIDGTWTRGSVRGSMHDEGWAARGRYPALVLDADAGSVDGFVLTSGRLEEHWGRLDAFEGADYDRVTTTVRLEDGREVLAFVYVLAGSAG